MPGPGTPTLSLHPPRALRPLLAPATIAVVGASADPGKAGHHMLRSLLGFPGKLAAVNPRARSILDTPCSPTVADLPDVPDLVILTVPPAAVPGALLEAAKAGVPAAVVCAGGFAEAGPDGAHLQEEIRRIVAEHGIRVLGPNTSGLVNPAAGLFASFVPGVAALRPGPLAVVAQSGGVHHLLDFLAAEEGLGISVGLGLGNAVDVGFADVLDYLADDPATAAVVLHIEGAGGSGGLKSEAPAPVSGERRQPSGIPPVEQTDGRRLAESVARCSAAKPVVAFVLGRADVRDFARSHTGALSGDWALTRAALAQAGAVMVDSTVEAIDAAKALALLRLHPDPAAGVGIVTGQAGPGLLLADALRSAGVAVPALTPKTEAAVRSLLPPITFQRNPVDTGRPGETFAAVAGAVAADPGVAVSVVYALVEPDALDPVAALGPLAAAGHRLVHVTGGPADQVHGVRDRLHALGVPVYTTPDRAAAGVTALVRDARMRAAGRPGFFDFDPKRAGQQHLGLGPLNEAQTKALLEQEGLTCPPRRVCLTRRQAAEAMAELGPGPVVVKVCDAGITHKSDQGGVHLGVAGPEALWRALKAIDAIPDSGQVRRYLIEAELPGGVELLVGARRDPSFGPVVLLGIGGIAAEATADVAMRLAPVGGDDVRSMAAELRGAALLHGFRGAPPVDLDRLAAMVHTVSDLVDRYDDVEEVELNPVRAVGPDLFVLDALLVTTCPPTPAAPQ